MVMVHDLDIASPPVFNDDLPRPPSLRWQLPRKAKSKGKGGPRKPPKLKKNLKPIKPKAKGAPKARPSPKGRPNGPPLPSGKPSAQDESGIVSLDRPVKGGWKLF